MRNVPKQLELFRSVPRPEPRQPEPRSPIPTADSARALAARLTPHLPIEIADLTLTNNRRRILSGRPAADGRLAVRVHRCFAEAPDPVLRAVACFLDMHGPPPARRAALEVVRRHYNVHAPQHDAAPHKPPKTRPRGRFFDLEEIRDRINREYFNDEVDVAISWGQAQSRSWKSRFASTVSRRFGVYLADLRLVRIHPSLDRADVPLYVIESIVHHEMLHAVVPPTPWNELSLSPHAGRAHTLRQQLSATTIGVVWLTAVV